MKLGAHVSVAGGLHNAVSEALTIGADTFQMFSKNQRQWIAKPLTEEQLEQFHTALTKSQLGPVMIHDSYLINMGSPDESKGKRAQHAFLDEYRRCEALGVPYLNFHPGSHTHPQKAMRDDRGTRDAALERIATHINTTLEKTDGFESLLVLENAAGQGTNVGITFTELAHILEHVEDQSRMGVCIDTQHAWASGYDWVSDYSGVWDEFDSLISRDRLVGMHLNDSLSDCGSRVDRHANHGEGKMGEGVFSSLMQDSRLDGIAGYLETPGGPDRWKPEIARLRELTQR